MIYAIVFFVVVLLDQLSKAVVYALKIDTPIIGDWLKILIPDRLNTGMAFSLLSDATWAQTFFYISTAVILLAFTVYLVVTKNKSPFLKTGIVFVMGGAVGNLIDRLAYKGVRDFIFVKYYSTFNIADSFVCIGAVMLIIYYLFLSKDALFGKKKKYEQDSQS